MQTFVVYNEKGILYKGLDEEEANTACKNNCPSKMHYFSFEDGVLGCSEFVGREGEIILDGDNYIEGVGLETLLEMIDEVGDTFPKYVACYSVGDYSNSSDGKSSRYHEFHAGNDSMALEMAMEYRPSLARMLKAQDVTIPVVTLTNLYKAREIPIKIE